VLAVIAAVALVLASAGIGAVVAVAVHGNNSSSNTAFPNVPGFNGNGSNNSNGFGNNPGGSSSNSSGSNGSSSSGSLNVSSIASTVTPAIVNINTTLAQGRAAGTGIVISSSGVVLTNNHVIADATSIKVDIGGTGNTHPAHVIGYDVQDDVALVQIEGVSNLKTVTFGDPSQVRVGDPVVAIGNALGKGGTPSVTSGKVTALNQQVTAGDPTGGRVETLHGMIQIDAPIEPGDSGGALVDANSHVIGINTAAAGGRFNQQTGSNIGFSIPIDNAVSIAKMIQNGTRTDRVHIGGRALLGVSVRAASDPTTGTQSPVSSGALVVGVQGNSAASNAGIQEGDVITQVAGRTIADDNALHNALTVFYPGQSVQITWVDANGNSHSATIKLGQGPPA
jgi:S1-C subfamily serine protease